MNYWHEVSRGKKIPESFNVIIEIPKWSPNKYEIDKETGLIALDRANYSAAPYPFDYGFVPQTLWEDGDALDVVLLTTFPLAPGILVHARPVALMDMIDCGESDVKIIAVPVDDRRFEDIHDLSDLNKHTLREYKLFFETNKILKGDTPDQYPIEVKGYSDKNSAMKAIEKAISIYDAKYKKI